MKDYKSALFAFAVSITLTLLPDVFLLLLFSLILVRDAFWEKKKFTSSNAIRYFQKEAIISQDSSDSSIL